MTEAERRVALEQVASEVRDCTRCRLHEGRTHAVPGEGHPSTEVLLVGEGPGLNEDRQGRPFVGAAGQFLTELLGSVGWRREEVFITNVVKCRPPGNRDPEPDEIEACAPFLRRQLDALDPALVVTLGRHSMGRFIPGARIGQVHGTFRPGPVTLGADRALVFAMYHPAAALHQGSLRQTLLDDMAQVPQALLEARRRRGDGATEAEEVTAAEPRSAAPAADVAIGGPPEAPTVAGPMGWPTEDGEPVSASVPVAIMVGPSEEAAVDADGGAPTGQPADAVPTLTAGPDGGPTPEPAALEPTPIEPVPEAIEPDPDLDLLVTVAAATSPGDAPPDDQMTLF